MKYSQETQDHCWPCLQFRYSLLLSSLQLRFNRLLKPREAALVEQPPVHEDRGGSAHVCLGGTLHIPVDERRYGGVLEVLAKLFHVEPELLGDLLYLCVVESLLVCEELMVHFPELPLFVGGEGSHGCLPRVAVHGEGILLDHQFDFLREFLQHLLEEGLKPRTVGSLVIVKDGNGDGSVRGSLERQPAHIDLIDALEQYDLETLIRAARNGQCIRSG